MVVGSSPTVGVAIAGVGIRGPCAPCHVQSALCIPRGGFWSGDPAVFSISAGMTFILPGLLPLFCFFFNKIFFLWCSLPWGVAISWSRAGAIVFHLEHMCQGVPMAVMFFF